eukprot:8731607-Heterocapsa_arctica.AAC.1
MRASTASAAALWSFVASATFFAALLCFASAAASTSSAASLARFLAASCRSLSVAAERLPSSLMRSSSALASWVSWKYLTHSPRS